MSELVTEHGKWFIQVKKKCPKCHQPMVRYACDKNGKLYCQTKDCTQVWVWGKGSKK